MENELPVQHSDSSPHERGKLEQYETMTTRSRFIPSCEGQTKSETGLYLIRMIHPLPRGADVGLLTPKSQAHDSSPHTMGRHNSRVTKWGDG